MTTEQRKAIELLERIHVSYFLSGMIEQSNYIVDKAYEADKAIDTALSLIKEQQEEIEKKDKQIDLMAEYISKQDVEVDICMKNRINADLCNEDYTNCKNCIKQYFERKVKDVKD